MRRWVWPALSLLATRTLVDCSSQWYLHVGPANNKIRLGSSIKLVVLLRRVFVALWVLVNHNSLPTASGVTTAVLGTSTCYGGNYS